MEISTLEVRNVQHRDGTVTTFQKVHLDLESVARRFMIWIRWLPVGWQGVLDEQTYWVEKIPRGGFNPDGSRRFVTRLVVRDPVSLDIKTITKTDLGRMYFHAILETLDEDGVTFWEDMDKPNTWILADVFSV